MQSTGEVIGLHDDPRVALAKALQGAALVPPRATGGPEDPPIALLSIADRDKAGLPRLARALARASYRLAATSGTRRALAAIGIEARLVARIAEEPDMRAPDGTPAPDLLALIHSGEVRLVINTPTPRSGAIRDAAEIRHAAVGEGILCLTAIETAIAAAEALDPAVEDRVAEVRRLTEWVPASRAAHDRPLVSA